MSAKRKLWGTKFPMVLNSPMRRHESKAAVYRYIRSEWANWQCRALRSALITIYVDEREGHGWQTYERIDLSDYPDQVVTS